MALNSSDGLKKPLILILIVFSTRARSLKYCGHFVSFKELNWRAGASSERRQWRRLEIKEPTYTYLERCVAFIVKILGLKSLGTNAIKFWGSEATFSFNRAYKLSNSPWLQASSDDLHSFAASSKGDKIWLWLKPLISRIVSILYLQSEIQKNVTFDVTKTKYIENRKMQWIVSKYGP